MGAGVVRLRVVLQLARQRGHKRLRLGRQLAVLVPARNERQHSRRQRRIRRAQQSLQRLLQFTGPHGNNVRLQILGEILDRDLLQRIRAHRLRRERSHDSGSKGWILFRRRQRAQLHHQVFKLTRLTGRCRSFDELHRTLRGDADDGGFEPLVVEIWIRFHQRLANLRRGRKRRDRVDGFEPDPCIAVVHPTQNSRRDIRTFRWRNLGRDAERGFLHRRFAIHCDRLLEHRAVEATHQVQRPQGVHLRLFQSTEAPRAEQTLGGIRRLRIVVLHEQTLRVLAHMAVRILQRFDQVFRRSLRDVRHLERLGLLVVHAPDAAEVMIAVRTQRRVGRAVNRSARVVVSDRLVVEVGDVKRAVGSDARVDRAEPFITSADELRFARLVRLEGDAIRLHNLMMDDVDSRLGGEVAVIPFRRPRAAAINSAARRRRKIADEIDLHVSLLVVGNQREGFLALDHGLVTRGAADLAARELALGHDDVVQQIAARRLRVEELAIRRDLHAPCVAALRGNLLDHRSVRLEPQHAGTNAAEVLRLVTVVNMRARAVAMRRVNPAVHTPAQVVDHRVRIASAEAGVELLNLLCLAVAINVAQPEDVRRLRDDDAVLVENEARHQL